MKDYRTVGYQPPNVRKSFEYRTWKIVPFMANAHILIRAVYISLLSLLLRRSECYLYLCPPYGRCFLVVGNSLSRTALGQSPFSLSLHSPHFLATGVPEQISERQSLLQTTGNVSEQSKNAIRKRGKLLTYSLAKTNE